MDLAPVEYLVISFPGSGFRGEIAPAIERLVRAGTVRILDLVFLTKDDDGAVSYVELDDLDDADSLASLDGAAGGIIGDEDVAEAALAIEPGTSALFVIWEDRWAAELGAAIRAAGGELVIGERIPHDAIAAALGATEA
jgi:uncharacterized membrane protein